MQTLTTRGWTFLAGGLIAAGAGWGFGQPAVITAALLIILMPLIGVVLVRRSRFVLGSARSVRPTRFPVGGEADVELVIENGSRLASGVLLLADRVPSSLGESPRLLLDRVRPREQRSVHYRVTGGERGHAVIGPLDVTVTDPFGTAALTRAFTAVNRVLVTPAIHELPAFDASAPGGTGETVFRSVAARGEDDVLPREHRSGDDMRRIHWRATARHGDLMVRREEQAWHSSLLVVLDAREGAHHGTGPASTFEWAVSAAASIAIHYLHRGWHVSVVTADGRLLADADDDADADELLRAFAEVRPGPEPLARTLLSAAEGAAAVVAVMGRLHDDAADVLVRGAAGFAGCLLLEPGPVERLRAAGWQVSPWVRSTPVAAAWSGLTLAPSIGTR